MDEQGILPFYMTHPLPIYSEQEIEIWYDTGEEMQADETEGIAAHLLQQQTEL